MPHNSDSVTRALMGGLGLIALLLAGTPHTAQAQSQNTLRTEAIVVSAEGTKSWQAVERRLQTAGSPTAAEPAGPPSMLATIVERTVPDEANPSARRRVLTVEYLRN